jgi:hypothetical protein
VGVTVDSREVPGRKPLTRDDDDDHDDDDDDDDNNNNTDNCHIGHCTHTSKSADIKVH